MQESEDFGLNDNFNTPYKEMLMHIRSLQLQEYVFVDEHNHEYIDARGRIYASVNGFNIDSVKSLSPIGHKFIAWINADLL